MSGGSWFKVRCYKPWCRHWNAQKVPYYFWKGQSCGATYNGWKRSMHADEAVAKFMNKAKAQA